MRKLVFGLVTLLPIVFSEPIFGQDQVTSRSLQHSPSLSRAYLEMMVNPHVNNKKINDKQIRQQHLPTDGFGVIDVIVNPPIMNHRLNDEIKPLPPNPSLALEEPYRKCFSEACSIIYVRDIPRGSDTWQTPIHTKERGRGDDLTFYLYDLFKKNGIRSRVVFGTMEGYDDEGHMWVETNKNNTIWIFDPVRHSPYVKDQVLNKPGNLDYIEYPESYGYRKKIEDFIKRFESGINVDYVHIPAKRKK